ncbi:hypothetical protein RCL1_002632 [Eukaryota sp. TZLM3-RCL]
MSLISPKDLASLIRDRDLKQLAAVGGLNTLVSVLETDLTDGLPKVEAHDNYSKRRSLYGSNTLPKQKSTSFFIFFLQALNDSTLIVLMIAAFISLVLAFGFSDGDDHAYIEGFAILCAVLVVSFVGSYNNFHKEKQFRKLNEVEAVKTVTVTRAGIISQIPSTDLLVGDIVFLRTGDSIPVDGLLIEGSNLSVDESSMTGESDHVDKGVEGNPFLLAGTSIVTGSGKLLTCAVGELSEWGYLLTGLSREKEDTPLQKKLIKLAQQIGIVGFVCAILVFLVLLFNFIMEIRSGKFSDVNFTFVARNLVSFLVVAVTIIVVAVPEGLPLAVTISLAYSVRKMMKDQNLVRHLSATETIGSATTICSDKTGTLTTNLMTVARGWIAEKLFSQVPESRQLNPQISALLAESIALNSDAHLTKTNGLSKFIGNPTEGALLSMISDWGVDYENLRLDFPKIYCKPFDSQTKLMYTLTKSSVFKSFYVLHVKGAGETILSLCTKQHNSTGETANKLTPLQRDKLSELQREMNAKGLRTIMMAYQLYTSPPTFDDSFQLSDLVALSFFGIRDPPRPESLDAILMCNRAGIKVRMVTGDNLITAKMIATELHILTNGIAIDGKTFRNLNDDEMDEILPRLQVLARSTPSDKHLLVTKLKERGECVAVTGDGANDSLCLKAANVGLSMGIQGVEIAKEASDIIILDDKFYSVVRCVLWGRSVFANVQKFLQFQLTVCFSALALSFLSTITKQGLPLNPVQLLFVNLIMDSLGALALSTEAPTPELLDQKPPGITDPLISPLMLKNILTQGSFQLIVLVAILYFGNHLFGVELLSTEHTTIIFTTFVFLQLFNEINCKVVTKGGSPFKGFFSNPMFTIVISSTIIMQFFLVTFGGNVIRTVPLSLSQWSSCAFIGSISLLVGAVVRTWL